MLVLLEREGDPTRGHSTPQTRTWTWRGPAGDSSQAHAAPSRPAPATEAPASGGSHRTPNTWPTTPQPRYSSSHQPCPKTRSARTPTAAMQANTTTICQTASYWTNRAVTSRHHWPAARILTGHLHRSSAAMFAGSLVTSAPSTYRQVNLDLDPSRPLAFVDEPPGLLLHHLQGETAVTHLLPVDHAGPPLGTL